MSFTPFFRNAWKKSAKRANLVYGNPLWGWVELLVFILIIVKILRGIGWVK
jgi:hypothetical protein